jgi:hypothetical protein
MKRVLMLYTHFGGQEHKETVFSAECGTTQGKKNCPELLISLSEKETFLL